MSDLIKKELDKVHYADLSNFDASKNTYYIKKRVDIKLDVDNCYLIKVKPSAATNHVVNINWNNNSPSPSHLYLKVDVSKVMGKMVKVVGVGYDFENKIDLASFWSGWLSTDDLEVISKL